MVRVAWSRFQVFPRCILHCFPNHKYVIDLDDLTHDTSRPIYFFTSYYLPTRDKATVTLPQQADGNALLMLLPSVHRSMHAPPIFLFLKMGQPVGILGILFFFQFLVTILNSGGARISYWVFEAKKNLHSKKNW
jgi:hypothetical protein